MMVAEIGLFSPIPQSHFYKESRGNILGGTNPQNVDLFYHPLVKLYEGGILFFEDPK